MILLWKNLGYKIFIYSIGIKRFRKNDAAEYLCTYPIFIN